LEDLLPPGFEDDSTYVIGLINLAQLTGAIHLLPGLFMICVWCLDGNTLLQGVAWLDASKDTLSPVDLAGCFDARRDLTRARINSLRQRIASLPSSDCSHSGACKNVLHALFLLAMSDEPYPFVRLCEFPTAQGLCSACQERLATLDEAEMSLIWAELPELVGLGQIEGWGEKRERE
ncbi:hypothetical protein K466DRAFT_494464, partial [Polyporus arcularius HHB13444]